MLLTSKLDYNITVLLAMKYFFQLKYDIYRKIIYHMCIVGEFSQAEYTQVYQRAG